MNNYDPKFIESIVSKYYSGLVLHGLEHVRRVVDYATEIAQAECPDNINDVVLAAYLHDIGRNDDNGGNEHAMHGAIITAELLRQHWPESDHDKIIFAIRYHADGQTTDDPLIGSLWDADRLDIGRAGLIVDIDLLSTEKGKEIARTRILQ